jgi:8-amino-7-oxononanoate synthase
VLLCVAPQRQGCEVLREEGVRGRHSHGLAPTSFASFSLIRAAAACSRGGEGHHAHGCDSGRVNDPLHWLGRAAGAQRAAGLERTLLVRPAGDGPLLDLAGNDYLRLSTHPDVVAASAAAARDFGTGATGSRLVTGTTVLHAALEDALAWHVGAPSALVFSSGYLANLGAVTGMAGPGTLVVSDRANHASVVDACLLSRARLVVVPHRDVDAVDRALAERHEERAVVVTDAVFSVSGRLAPLDELHTAVRRSGAVLLVDEAHALGVVGQDGRGVAATLGLAAEPDVVLTATLSKALGSQGGAVLGPVALRQHLINTARAFVFDTGLAPPCVGAALAALQLVTPDRVQALRQVAHALADELGVPRTDSAVVPVPVGDASRAAAARDRCAAEGILVGCFRPPSVPAGASCLRLTARADLTNEDIAVAAKVVRAAL